MTGLYILIIDDQHRVHTLSADSTRDVKLALDTNELTRIRVPNDNPHIPSIARVYAAHDATGPRNKIAEHLTGRSEVRGTIAICVDGGHGLDELMKLVDHVQAEWRDVTQVKY